MSVFLVNCFKITGRIKLTQAGPAAGQPITTLGDTAQEVVIEIHCLVEVSVLANGKIQAPTERMISLQNFINLHRQA